MPISLLGCLDDRRLRLAERAAGRQVERDRRGHQPALMVHLRRGVAVGVGQHRPAAAPSFRPRCCPRCRWNCRPCCWRCCWWLGWLRRWSSASSCCSPVLCAVLTALACLVTRVTVPPGICVCCVPVAIARGRAQENLVERLRILPVLRRHLHHHEVLIERVVDRRNGALAERVIQHVVDLVRREAIARRRGAVDIDVGLQTVLLQVRVDVEQLRRGTCRVRSRAWAPT